MHTPRPLLTALLVSTLCACANGSSISAIGYEQQGGGDGEGGEGGADPATTSSSASGQGGAGGEAGMGGAGGGQGGGGGAGGAEPACAYDAPTPCAGAEELDSVSGDSGTDVTTASGNTSRWFKIFVAEDSFGSTQLSYTASLVSPAGMNFDLYLYRGSASAPNCLATGVKGVGTPESLTEHWGDVFAGDDDAWYIVEVRYASGTACDAAATWTLSFAGHTVP